MLEQATSSGNAVYLYAFTRSALQSASSQALRITNPIPAARSLVPTTAPAQMAAPRPVRLAFAGVTSATAALQPRSRAHSVAITVRNLPRLQAAFSPSSSTFFSLKVNSILSSLVKHCWRQHTYLYLTLPSPCCNNCELGTKTASDTSYPAHIRHDAPKWFSAPPPTLSCHKCKVVKPGKNFLKASSAITVTIYLVNASCARKAFASLLTVTVASSIAHASYQIYWTTLLWKSCRKVVSIMRCSMDFCTT